MIGQTISHYRILEELGRGGMGVVYKALDLTLDRIVALKFLPDRVNQSEVDKSRFLQEARAAAGLNHNNICTIYGVDEHEGHMFIAMEWIEGGTLRDKLPFAEPDEAIAMAIQVGEALQEAHVKGIVHRDIKADNVMLTSKGQPKVMDFGLAKLKGTLKLTRTSSTVGTIAYMPPEQIRGGEADARSDIFSFGILLFEILTGKTPFRGEHDASRMYSILNEDPESVLKYRPDLSPNIDRIICRALEKELEDRYQSVADMVSELRREQKKSGRIAPPVTTDAAAVTPSSVKDHAVPADKPRSKKLLLIPGGVGFVLAVIVAIYLFTGRQQTIDSLAVIPFENKNSDTDAEYLSDGLAESLIYRLSQLPDLKVSPTSSVLRYRDKDMEPAKIGSDLGVSAVITGRMVQRGNNLTISVELVDVRNNKLLWGEQYERTLADLLATQREIATEIAQRLQLKLSGGENGLTKHYTESNEAYQLYLKGRYYFAKRTRDDVQRGIDYFQQATILDPHFALAYARMAEAYNQLPSYPYRSPGESFPRAIAAAKRALEIDPALAEAHTALANSLAVYEWNWNEAEREFKRALDLDPNSAAAHFRYGQLYLTPMGRPDEAIAEVKRALELEPLDLTMGAVLSGVYVAARQYDQAVDQAQRTLDLEPTFPLGRWMLGQAYISKGMYGEASGLSDKSLQNDPTNQSMLRNAGYVFARTGRRAEAEDIIRRFKEIARTQYVMSSYVASIYAALGDKDKAFAELDKAAAEHDWNLHRLNVDPFIDPLRDDPRFAALVKKVGLERR